MLNYTENYQLPQWVESDRVLMEDFNTAMRKTDLELHRLFLQPTFGLLKEYVSEDASTQVDIDVSDIAWTDYMFVLIYFSLRGDWNEALIRLNNTTYGSHIRYLGAADTITNQFFRASLNTSAQEQPSLLLVETALGPNRTVCALGFDGEMAHCTSNVPLKDLATINLVSQNEEYPIKEGSVVRIWGIR